MTNFLRLILVVTNKEMFPDAKRFFLNFSSVFPVAWKTRMDYIDNLMDSLMDL